MAADIARLLLLLVNTGSLAFCVLVLWLFAADTDATPFYDHLKAFELPLSNVLSASTSPVPSKPLLEPIPKPYRDLPSTQCIFLLKIHNHSAGGPILALENFPLQDAHPYHSLS
jgi:hypothetical protein